MDNNRERIRRAVSKMAQPISHAPFAWAEVTEVDEGKMLVDCKDTSTGLEYFDCAMSLAAIVPVPDKGSLILLGLISKNGENSVVLWVDKVVKYLLNIDGTTQTLEATKDGWKFNGGDLGGVVKIEQLIERLNAIEDAHNNFLTEYKTHIHSLNVAGAVTIALTPLSTQQNVQKTQRDPLEDKKVKH